MAESAFPEVLTNSRFYLEIKLNGSKDSVDGYFMECSGFEATQEAIEICEVTPQLWGKKGNTKGRVVRTKLPGNTKYTNLVLRRGLTCSMTLWNWIQSVQNSGWADERRDGSLVLYNQAAEEQFRLEFKRAWPIRYKLADVSAAGSDHEIEEVEVAIEELKRVNVTT